MTGTLHEELYTLVIISHRNLPGMRSVSDKMYREILNTHFMFSNFSPGQSCRYEIMWKKGAARRAICTI
jgi:hypothetical protein